MSKVIKGRSRPRVFLTMLSLFLILGINQRDKMEIPVWAYFTFFLTWAIFKVFVEFVTILLLLFMFSFFVSTCESLAPQWGMEHTPCIGRWSLNLWTPTEVPRHEFWFSNLLTLWPCKSSSVKWELHIHVSFVHSFNWYLIPWRREWLPTPVFLPGKPHGQRSLAGCSPWGRKSGTWLSD